MNGKNPGGARFEDAFPENAGGGIRTHELLREWALNPSPLTWLGNPRLGHTVSWGRLLINLWRKRDCRAGWWRMVPFTEVLCKMSSDVHHMARKELHHDRDAVLLLAGHLRGAGTGAAKSNAKTRGTGSVLKRLSHNSKSQQKDARGGFYIGK